MFWKFRKTSRNLIEELFDADHGRINEVKAATLSTLGCLHEAGHLLAAMLQKLTVEAVWLPNIDSFFDGSARSPGVQIANRGSDEAKFFFHMGGLFGEVNPFRTKDFEDRWEDLIVLTAGAAGDLVAAFEICPNPAVRGMIANAMSSSKNGIERQLLLRHLHFHRLPEFEVFRAHRAQHLKLASAMYERWRAAGFQHVDLPELVKPIV